MTLFLLLVSKNVPKVVGEIARKCTDAEGFASGLNPVAPIKVWVRCQFVAGDYIGDLCQNFALPRHLLHLTHCDQPDHVQ